MKKDERGEVRSILCGLISPLSFFYITSDNYFAFSSIYLIASPTVAIDSDLSSGIVMLNSFSNSIINSTVSRESAPRSFVKLASGLTSASSTPSLSTMIAFTFDSISDIIVMFKVFKLYSFLKNRMQRNEFLFTYASFCCKKALYFAQTGYMCARFRLVFNPNQSLGLACIMIFLKSDFCWGLSTFFSS